MDTITDRRQFPPIKNIAEIPVDLKDYDYAELDNGIPVYSIAADNQETLQVEFTFAAGDWYEPRLLVAEATNYLMKKGTAKHSSHEISESVEYYGAYLTRRCSHESATFSLHCLSKHTKELLPVLQEVLMEPTFPQDELELFQQNRRQRLEVNLKKCDFVANRYIDRYLFGEFHPYGRVGSMDAYAALQREGLEAFYKAHYTYDNCKIFIAGNVPEGFMRWLNDYFGKSQWNGESKINHNDFALQPALEKKYRIINDEQGVQGAIRLARLFPNRQHADFAKMMVLNIIFGGYFGSRLMANIREDKGYTYGIYSSMYNFKQASAINIHTEAGREVCEAAIDEIYKEMQLLKDEPVPAEELALVRNYMLGSLLGDLDGPFQIITRWKFLILNDLDKNYFMNNIETIKTISAEELQQIAQRYYVPEDFYELVVV